MRIATLERIMTKKSILLATMVFISTTPFAGDTPKQETWFDEYMKGVHLGIILSGGVNAVSVREQARETIQQNEPAHDYDKAFNKNISKLLAVTSKIVLACWEDNTCINMSEDKINRINFDLHKVWSMSVDKEEQLASLLNLALFSHLTGHSKYKEYYYLEQAFKLGIGNSTVFDLCRTLNADNKPECDKFNNHNQL